MTAPNPRTPATPRLGLIFGLAAALALTACGGGPEGEGDAATDDKEASAEAGENGKPEDEKKVEAVPVEVESVATRRIAASYSGTANLEVPADAQVVAKTGGVLLRVLVEEGDTVQAGQPLAQIDPERTRLEVARAEATMRRLQANFERSKELFERKLVSADANDQLRYEFESAKAAYDLARLELSYTTITAPISGVVAQRMAKPGNLIALNAPVYRIVDNSHLEAVLNVPEREMRTMRDGLPVRMVVDALAGEVFQGEVDRISPVVDAQTGTFRVVGVFRGQPQLKPGMFGRLSIVYEERDAALTVPRVALVEGAGESAVFVVEDGKAVRRVLRLGYINGEFAEVVEGLEAGENVITQGRVAVRDGAEVEVLNGADAKPSPAAAVAEASSSAADAG
ncbi:MAG: efflux RND transporter periplasmic adaptor subunit [Silanimonas sp.]